MPKRSCALIGRGTGPLVQIIGLSSLQLRGMRENEQAEARLLNGGPEPYETLVFGANGEHPLPKCSFAEVTYRGANRHFLAFILMGD
jgi:hypothetical protein